MVNLLESMHKCCLPAGVSSESPSAYEKSLVHKIFGGRLRSQVKCMQCSFCSDKFDPFLDLSLEIIKAESLHKALTHFTAKEYLDGGERQYQCQKCKHKVKALKQLTIHQAPHVLTIHLKRFGAHQAGQKVDKRVQFGPTLDLKPFVTGLYEGDLKYTLYGVLVHAGWSTHSGHYHCYIRTSSGMWYSLDDHQVRQVSEKVVLEQKAYMLFYVRDRTNSALKKHVGFVQKESMITNAIGNKMRSTLNQGSRETVQNGPIDKRVIDSAAAVTRNNVIISDVLMESLTKEASIQKTRGPTLEISSKVPISNNAVNRLPILHLNGEHLTKSACIEGSDKTVNNALGATTDGKTSDCNKDRCTKEDNTDLVVVAPNAQVLVTNKDQSFVNAKAHMGNDTSTKKDMSDSITIAPELNGHQSSAGDSCIMETTPQKIHSEASLQKSNERESAFIDHVKSLDEPSCVNIQAKGLLTDSTLGDGGQRKGVIESVGSSGIRTMHISSPIGAVDRKRQQKLKKKLPKCPINNVHLGSSILFGVYLSLRKKKHKKIKRRVVKIGNVTKEHLMDSECSPSMSEITRTLSFNGKLHSQGKRLKSCSTKKDNVAVAKSVKSSDGNLARGMIDEEFRERIVQNGAVLSTDIPPLRNFCFPLTGNESGARCANGTKESSGDSVQNGLMSMLTRGLEEKTVARWDGIELPPHITESSCVQSVRVGYIGDEWDEEYDRGKRKKVRISENVFGGPNPFQAIASKKAKLKKVKMDQSSSGNRPYRI
ncbi:hypothetical protein RHMOL_Rhmol01G0028800 [Rhododendron molle]|uniref:Uncharacterized protein n=1 Tax=Rhododendron molle TaxID=49168 RepID=A0ACC0PYY1_RHOML|nr:hypothetical protein RHMOL_Rhmol01G0028800 [Rhododendron molle]